MQEFLRSSVFKSRYVSDKQVGVEGIPTVAFKVSILHIRHYDKKAVASINLHWLISV
jgi:hypothetical protein